MIVGAILFIAAIGYLVIRFGGDAVFLGLNALLFATMVLHTLYLIVRWAIN